MKTRVTLAAVLMSAAVALGPGCSGSQGPTGPQGPAGPAGDAGPPGNPAITLITVPSNAQAPTDAQSAAWAALQPQVTIQSVTISSPPVVKFKVTDQNGIPIAGLGNTSQSATASAPGLTNLSFALAKLVAGSNGSPSKWVSYIVTTVPSRTSDGGVGTSAPTRPTTDNTGNLVDNGDGTYAYTFYRDVTKIKDQVAAATVSPPNNTADLGDLTYDGTLVHRATIQLGGNAPGTGSNTPTGATNVTGVPMQHPFDAVYDFTPSTGAAVTDSGREIVATAKCNECHRVLGGIPGDPNDSSAASFHGGNRNNTQYCVVCHTEQRKYGQTEAAFDSNNNFVKLPDGGVPSTYRVYDRAIGNFPNQMHHFHAGPVLALKGYNYAGVTFNDILFPQDLRNCTKCHDGSDASTAKTGEGDNWKKVPSRLACGGCHDGIDFSTGEGVTLRDAMAGLTSTTKFNGLAHGGFAQADDSRCVLCHSPAGVDIDLIHRPVTPPADNNSFLPGGTEGNTNAAWIASNPARLPAGAIAVSYDIKQVYVDSTTKNPVMVFRMLQNGARKDLNKYSTATPNPATGAKEIWDNFMGSPSVYFVFAVPQDGITAPADFNVQVGGYLRGIWNGNATGTGAGTLSDPDANGYYTVTLTGVKIPASAVMLTGGLGFSYSLSSTLPLTQTAAADGTPFRDEAGAPTYQVWNAGTTDMTQPCVTAANAASPKCNGGLIVIAPNAQKVGDKFTGRRPIVEDARCNACHQELGAFTEDAFHAGQRNDGTSCAWCHRPNRTSSGWASDSVNFVHAIHAAAKRDVKFTWDAPGPATVLPDGGIASESFADIEYPGVLRDCQTCHLPGTYDFSAGPSAAALPNRLYRTVATGAFRGTIGDKTTTYTYNTGTGQCDSGSSSGATALQVFELSPYITPAANGTATPNYGVDPYTFYNAGATDSNQCTPDGTPFVIQKNGGSIQKNADGTDNAVGRASMEKNFVNSPIAGVCFACHDTSADMAHFDLNGGAIYQARKTAVNGTETCLICHGSGQIADIAEVHKP